MKDMFKMIKYELRKSMMPILIILGLIAASEIAYLIGLAISSPQDDGKKIVASIMALCTLGVVSYIFLFINGIVMFDRDLKNKEGYLVFMAPVSIYGVIGAKLITILIETAAFTVGYILLGIGDILLLFKKENVTMSQIRTFLNKAFNIKISNADMLYVVVCLFVAFFTVFTFAYFSIAISKVLFGDRQGLGKFVAFVIFIALSFLSEQCAIKIGNLTANNADIKTEVVQITANAVMALIAYFATAWLLKKKINL